jgi:O-antigen ligase
MKDSRASFLILLGPLVSIAALPGLMIDTTNLIKLLILGIISCGLAGYLLIDKSWLSDTRLLATLVMIGIFLVALMVPLFFSGSPFELQLYGSYGRNTGFITYFFLILVALSAITQSSENLMFKVARGIVATGAIETFYTYLQYFKIDPIDWQNVDGWLFGTFINPNFLSAFLGFSCVIIFVFLFDNETRLVTRLVLAFQLIATFFIIGKSQSIQGIAITIIGVSILIYLWLRKKYESRAINFGYAALVLIGSVVSVFSFLQKGPLKNSLYQESISFRGDYWQAGWQMLLHHPLTGVGLDSYGNWYLQYRTLTAATRRGPEVISTAAHNLFLDFAANGGILLVLIYLVLNVMVLVSIIRVFHRSKDVGLGFTSISLAWIAYLAQSIISINYIALAVWGWLFAGLIVGYERSTSSKIHPASKGAQPVKRELAKKVKRKATQNPKVGSHSGLIFVCCVIGAVIALPPFVGDISWKSALGSGDPNKLISAVNDWPRNTYRFDATAKGYANNGEVVQALQLSLDSIAFNDRSFDSWRLIIGYPNSTSEQKALALSKLKDIDVHYSSR